jgi:hypothetical protein
MTKGLFHPGAHLSKPKPTTGPVRDFSKRVPRNGYEISWSSKTHKVPGSCYHNSWSRRTPPDGIVDFLVGAWLQESWCHIRLRNF